MKIKIYGGTTQDRHLCPDCSYSHIIKGQRDGESVTLCKHDPMVGDGSYIRTIEYKVAECNKFEERTQTKLLEMKQKASYLYRLASGRWVTLHAGQLNDAYFMRALAKQDGERDYDREAKEFLKKAAGD